MADSNLETKLSIKIHFSLYLQIRACNSVRHYFIFAESCKCHNGMD